MEKTLVLIKPDACERNLEQLIIDIYEEKGLIVKEKRIIHADAKIATEHYIEHKDKPYFNDLISYITRSPVMAIVLEGNNAVKRVRGINGCTNPNEAERGTIRRLYAISKNENSVHASDSKESAKREIKIWFN